MEQQQINVPELQVDQILHDIRLRQLLASIRVGDVAIRRCRCVDARRCHRGNEEAVAGLTSQTSTHPRLIEVIKRRVDVVETG